MSDFFGGSNGLQRLGLILSSLNPQSQAATVNLMGVQQQMQEQQRRQQQEQAAQQYLSAQPAASPEDAYQRDLMFRALGPQRALEMEIQRRAQAAAPIKLAAGEGMYTPTGQPIVQAPFKPAEDSAIMRDAMALSGGDRAKALDFVNKWRTPASTTIDMRGDKAITGVDAKRYETTATRYDTLRNMRPGLDRMIAAIDQGAQTGFGQQWILPFKQAAEEAFGVKIPGTSEQEVFRSIQNNLGPAMRIPGAGASSDRDVNLFLDSIPSLAKSEGGNRMIADYFNRIEQRTGDVAAIQQDLLSQFNQIPIAEERKRIDALGPLFSKEERDILENAKKSAPKMSQTTNTQPPQTYSEGGVSGTFTGDYRDGKPVYRTQDGRRFVVE